TPEEPSANLPSTIRASPADDRARSIRAPIPLSLSLSTANSWCDQFLAHHTHSVWTHSSQVEIIDKWQHPLIPGISSGNTCGHYGYSAASPKRNSLTAPTCTATTSVGSSAASATLA